MNVETGTEAARFLFWECIISHFLAVWLEFEVHISVLPNIYLFKPIGLNCSTAVQLRKIFYCCSDKEELSSFKAVSAIFVCLHPPPPHNHSWPPTISQTLPLPSPECYAQYWRVHKGYYKRVRCTKLKRALFFTSTAHSWIPFVLYSRAVSIFKL
jgi:hypothetical protein